jgi:hypothetical protein
MTKTADLPKVIPNTCHDVKLLRVSYFGGLGEDSVQVEDLPIIAWTYEKHLVTRDGDDWQLHMTPQTIQTANPQCSMDFIVYGEQHYGLDGRYGGREETIEQALVELRSAHEEHVKRVTCEREARQHAAGKEKGPAPT